MTDDTNEHLGIGHLTGDLRGRAVRGAFSILVFQTIQFTLGLVSTATLARLLEPSDFGLVAMATAVSGFLSLFLELGLGAAAVQRSDLSQSQINTLFWINAAFGLALAAVMAAAAPLVARFYSQPELLGVTLALSVCFITAGVSVQPAALLRRQMRFASQATIDTVSFALGIIAGVTAAALGARYWALVYSRIVQQTAAAVGTCLVCRWRPTLTVRLRAVRSLLSFGVGLTGFNFLTYLSSNLDNVIIGRATGTAALGLYLKSYSLLMLPLDRIRGPVSSVTISALSRLQHDPAQFKSHYLGAMTSMAALGMPVVVFLFVFADEAILLVLGPQWKDSVILFRILAPAAFVETLNAVGFWACTPFGRTDRLLRWQSFATSVTVAALLAGVRWGAAGVAAAVSVSTIALRPVAIAYLLRDSPIRPVELYRQLARPARASLGAGVIVFAGRAAMVTTNGAGVLVLEALVFVTIYLGLWLVTPGGRRAAAELPIMLKELTAGIASGVREDR
jgi:O-antigen/teichoic acid export membrane protein